jgi:hypothetical protein
MKPALWLRIASILTLIHAVLHTVGGMFGGPRNAEQAAALASAQSLRFQAFGLTRSYWHFYFGFGLVTSLTLLLLSALLWQLSSLVLTDPAKARPFLAMLFLMFIALSVISWYYFFAPPFVTEIIIAAVIGVAFVPAGKKEPA